MSTFENYRDVNASWFAQVWGWNPHLNHQVLQGSSGFLSANSWDSFESHHTISLTWEALNRVPNSPYPSSVPRFADVRCGLDGRRILSRAWEWPCPNSGKPTQRFPTTVSNYTDILDPRVPCFAQVSRIFCWTWLRISSKSSAPSIPSLNLPWSINSLIPRPGDHKVLCLVLLSTKYFI